MAGASQADKAAKLKKPPLATTINGDELEKYQMTAGEYEHYQKLRNSGGASNVGAQHAAAEAYKKQRAILAKQRAAAAPAPSAPEASIPPGESPTPTSHTVATSGGGMTMTLPGGGTAVPTTQPANQPSSPSGTAQLPGGSLPGGNIDLSGMFNGRSNEMFENIYNQATNGSVNSYNTAANRLRERVDASTQGYQDQAQNRNLSRGFGDSGINNADISRVQSQGQQTYAQGLNDLSNTFETQRQNGLNIASGAANGVGQNNQFKDNQLIGWMNNERNRQSSEGIARAGNASNEKIGKMNNQSQQQISQLQQQNNNWQQSLQQLFNSSGLFNS